MATGNFSIALKDKTGETSVMVVPTVDLTPDATDQSTVAGMLTSLKAALEGISLGNVQKFGGSYQTRESNQASASGQRELKLLVQLEDDTTFKIHTVEVPIIDESSITFKSESDEVDLEASPRGGTFFDAFATALETAYRSPAGNTATVFGARLIGRNL
jgi:hypothetical protein